MLIEQRVEEGRARSPHANNKERARIGLLGGHIFLRCYHGCPKVEAGCGVGLISSAARSLRDLSLGHDRLAQFGGNPVVGHGQTLLQRNGRLPA